MSAALHSNGTGVIWMARAQLWKKCNYQDIIWNRLSRCSLFYLAFCLWPDVTTSAPRFFQMTTSGVVPFIMLEMSYEFEMFVHDYLNLPRWWQVSHRVSSKGEARPFIIEPHYFTNCWSAFLGSWWRPFVITFKSPPPSITLRSWWFVSQIILKLIYDPLYNLYNTNYNMADRAN